MSRPHLNIFNSIKLKAKIMACVMLIACSAFRFGNPIDESTVKALFIYNFTKHVDWPGTSDKKSFVIAVYGKTDIVKALRQITANKKYYDLPIVIKNIHTIEDAADCQLLFIPKNYSDVFEYMMEVISGKQILIVTEDKNMATKGACINIIQQEDKLRFELNETAMNKAGLKVSTQLLNFAIIIK